MLTVEQRALRKTGIGGTDIAAIMGFSPWSTPLQVYADKVLEPEESQETDAMHWGSKLEPVVADEFAARHKVTLKGDVFIRMKGVEFAIGNPDRIIVEDGVPLEIKTAIHASDDWGEGGGDWIPRHYLMQCAWYAMLTNAPRCEIAVLLRGHDYREYRYDRNEKLEKVMLERAEAFWTNHVLKRVPPEPMGEAPDESALRSLYRAGNGVIRQATATEAVTIATYRHARKLREEWGAAEELHKQQIMAAIGNDDGIEDAVGKITWKKNKDGTAVDYKTLWIAAKPALDPALVAKLEQDHTHVRTGPRVFRLGAEK